MLEAAQAIKAQGPFDVVVVDRIWGRELIDMLVKASGAKHLVVMQWESPGQWSDIRWRISPTSRKSLVAFVNALADGLAPQSLDIANLFHRSPSGSWEGPKRLEPLSVADLFGSTLDLAFDLTQVFGLDPDEAAQTRYLVLNMGCPYRGAKNPSGFLTGLDLPTQWGDGGCTFCNVGPYERQTRSERRALMVAQVENLALHGSYRRLVVQDEYIFRDIDVLVEVVLAHAPAGVDLLVRARVDYLESCREILVEALNKLGTHGSITPYLIGFENFSDAELTRYNKGQTAAQGLQAARDLDALSALHPNLHVSPSQGFILFGPWTTMEDLKINLRALRDVSFSRFRGSITQTKLRLNPDAALVSRARADGLLIEDYVLAHQDNAAGTGYQAEIPYRFQHPEVARVWDQLQGGHSGGSQRSADELDRLAAAISLIEAEDIH